MKIAAIQMNASGSMDAALDSAFSLAREAAAGGARLAALPEYFSYYGPENTWAEAAARGGEALGAMSALARENGIYLLAGGVLLPAAAGKAANVSVLFGPDGEEAGRYRKIHLFNASVPGREYRESDWLEPGREAAVAKVEDWTLGFGACFDLRFPEHFQKLRRMGAEVIAAPSAFTYETGMDHWLPLIRARAIETQCYLIAPALTGGEAGRRVFGSTAIIDPWGGVLGLREEGEGIVAAEIEKRRLEEVRRRVPMDF
ncbi:MAG: nitrilase-related carbon-nitrogen hydrolase [Candidatus Nitrospinota bacterium M3_3B_026]